MTDDGHEVRSDQRSGVVKGACPHDCPDQCAWHVTVADARALAVRGDPEHAFTDGVLCSKLKRYTERVYHPERIIYPQRRVGPKGSGKFERVSWETALADIAGRWRAIIEQHGGVAILPYSFAGTIGLVQRYAGAAFFRHLGATAVLGDYCGAVAYAGVAQTNGNALGVLPEDLEHARTIVLWGTNTAITNLHLWSGPIRLARERGAQVIVIDPVQTHTAQHADWHLAIAPGTDAALALGVMHVVIRDGLQDADYVARFTVGYDQLAARVNEFPPARVAAITGIATADIERLARIIATERPAVIRLLVGMERRADGAEAFRAIACIPALTGLWREVGGGLCHFTVDLFRGSLNYDALARPDLTPAAPRSIHIAELGKALTEPLAPPIKSLVVYNANPAVAAPHQNRVMRGLARDDLFTVVLEHFKTDTARYADYLLPATTQIEHLDLMASWGTPYLTLNEAAIDPVGDALPNSEIFRRLATAMHCDEAFLHTTDDQMIQEIIDSRHPYLHGIDYDRLRREGSVRLNVPRRWRPHENGEFATPSGKCEFYSAKLAAEGLDPLPNYTPAQTGSPDYPLNLISAKTAAHALNSQYVKFSKARTASAPELLIHPRDAVPRGITSGAFAEVFNERGTVVIRAKIARRVSPGVVAMPFNCWPEQLENGVSANALTADGLSSMAMGSDAFDTFVEVRRAGNGSRIDARGAIVINDAPT